MPRLPPPAVAPPAPAETQLLKRHFPIFSGMEMVNSDENYFFLKKKGFDVFFSYFFFKGISYIHDKIF